MSYTRSMSSNITRTVTPTRARKIRKLRAEGNSITVCAASVGLPRSTVASWLTRNKVEVPEVVRGVNAREQRSGSERKAGPEVQTVQRQLAAAVATYGKAQVQALLDGVS